MGIVQAGVVLYGLAGRLGNGYKDASTRARLVIRANLARKPAHLFAGFDGGHDDGDDHDDLDDDQYHDDDDGHNDHDDCS